MEITVNIKAPELAEAINNLAAAIAATGEKNLPFLTINDITENISPAEKEKIVESLKDAVIASSSDTPATDQSQPENPKEETVTSDMLRTAFMEKVKIGKSELLKNILKEMGFEKLSDISEENYAKAYDLVKAV